MARRTGAGAESSDEGISDQKREEESAPEDLNLKPSAMRGSEAMYGYLVALELIIISILNLTVTHGPGAPTGPQHVLGGTITARNLSIIGLVTSVAVMGAIQTRNRFVVPFSAIIAAFFVTLPKVPNSLSTIHILALIVPIVYAFILTQRQRKATMAQGRSGRLPRPITNPADRRAEAVRRRQARRQGTVTTGPPKNRRYTPPKAKRPRR